MRVFRILPPVAFTPKSCLPKICQNSGQAHPDARKIFRAFFVAAGAKRKTMELSVRSLCTTARSTDPEVGYKPQSPLKLEYIRQENGSSTDCAFSGQVGQDLESLHTSRLTNLLPKPPITAFYKDPMRIWTLFARGLSAEG